ncbi:hypothetical protein CRM22_008728 [Opisthorchis felineus]|uniref:RRM domain-containing protein n=1 Tax=Opisthorchis felineus TaxID=147828 RepID=A0A4S2L9W4_OPIFE|nr:hypothetical protein CRM22_008728 [Opisthorchis felineus]
MNCTLGDKFKPHLSSSNHPTRLAGCIKQEGVDKKDYSLHLFSLFHMPFLSNNIDAERLKEAFLHYGPITSAKVMTDANGRSKGFGFVCFTQPEQAARAVTEMDAALVGSKPLYVALAQRKEDRRAKLIAEHQQRLAQYRSPVTQMLPAAAAHAAALSYFPPTAFPQAQRYYHPTSAVISSQPRWNRAAAMSGGMPAQLFVGPSVIND